MKPEKERGSLLQRSFRRSFRRTRKEEAVAERKSAEQAEQEEQKLISELQNTVSDVIDTEKHGENFFRRCLKAKNLDVKEAEKLIRMIVNYEKIMRVDLAEKEIKLVQVKILRKVNKDFLGTGFLGFDKEGSPVRLVNVGSIDLKGVVNTTSTIEIMKLFVHFLDLDEKALRIENEKTGRKTYQCVLIFDMENLSTAQAMYKPIIDTSLVGLKLLQDYYNDILKCIFIINAPAIFATVYKMLKPAIGEDLQKRIKIFGREEWKEPVLELIDADVLPKKLGGNRSDANGDPKCAAFIGQGGIISEIYYTKEDSLLDSDMPDVQTVTVPAASCMNIPFEIREPGTILKYHVHSKDNDIGIGLYYEPFSDNEQASTSQAAEDEELTATKKADQKAVLAKFEQLIPIIRSQCQITPEIGHMYAWRAGRYIVHLDNTYSWMSPKQVLYKVDVVPPGEQFESNDEKLVESIKNL